MNDNYSTKTADIYELDNYIKSCRLQEYEAILVREISTYNVTNYLYDRETGSYTRIV